MELLEKIQAYKQEINAATAQTASETEAFRIRFLGSKGLIKELFASFKEVPNEQKKAFGHELNTLKQLAEQKLEVFQGQLSASSAAKKSPLDLTRPSAWATPGALHPVELVRREMLDIFRSIGFSVAEGPEIEDDWHNFSALNFPPEHPARDMQDTFFVPAAQGKEDFVLRTHTSSVQIRTLENQKPPVRVIAPGRVFRNEAISARSHCIFHQVEGVYVDEGVSFADLKQTLEYFAREFFGKSKIRLRPSYFPFTEPSAEMDVYWGLETEVDYRITKGTGWLEVLGCGMFDPNVLENCGIDSTKYTGYAFGIGIERIAMQRYGIPDIRMLFENDSRFLGQFSSAF